jgi:flavin-binding protein dodecin
MNAPEQWEGTSTESFEAALKEAHKKAAAAGKTGKRLVVKAIHVTGDNPIREYSVVLGPGG